MCQDNGAARNECRVLCKNSNDSTAWRLCSDGFIAETSPCATHFSWPPSLVKLLIVKWAEMLELHRVLIASRVDQRRNVELIAYRAIEQIFFAEPSLR
jgi:hypothetical protein